MHIPLVKRAATASDNSYKCNCNAILLFCAISTLLYLLTHADFSEETALNSESPVSVDEEISWEELIDIYFAFAHLPERMKHGSPFQGSEDPSIPLSQCKQRVMTCEEICKRRVWAEDSGGEPDRCAYTNQGLTLKCWDPRKMRCWNSIFGGSIVYDGSRDWTVLRHWRGPEEGQPIRESIRWIHMRNIDLRIDLFLFGTGRTRGSNVDTICLDIKKNTIIKDQLREIHPEHTAFFAGHSEGSAYALCADKFMRISLGMANPRKIVTTGTFLSSALFQTNLETDARFLLSAYSPPRYSRGEQLEFAIPDLMSLYYDDVGLTFPQFGYSCRKNSIENYLVCNEPQPYISIDIGIAILESGEFDKYLTEYMLHEVHSLRFYRECYEACFGLFQRTGDISHFATNAPSFSKMNDPFPSDGSLGPPPGGGGGGPSSSGRPPGIGLGHSPIIDPQVELFPGFGWPSTHEASSSGSVNPQTTSGRSSNQAFSKVVPLDLPGSLLGSGSTARNIAPAESSSYESTSHSEEASSGTQTSGGSDSSNDDHPQPGASSKSSVNQRSSPSKPELSRYESSSSTGFVDDPDSPDTPPRYLQEQPPKLSSGKKTLPMTPTSPDSASQRLASVAGSSKDSSTNRPAEEH